MILSWSIFPHDARAPGAQLGQHGGQTRACSDTPGAGWSGRSSRGQARRTGGISPWFGEVSAASRVQLTPTYSPPHSAATSSDRP